MTGTMAPNVKRIATTSATTVAAPADAVDTAVPTCARRSRIDFILRVPNASAVSCSSSPLSLVRVVYGASVVEARLSIYILILIAH